MSNEEERKQEVPEVEQGFAELLKKFRVGVKDGMAETIVENIARTGGERVFEDPQRLAERLATWHEYITPVRRRQVLEQWFAEKGIEVPSEAVELAGIKTSEVNARKEAQKKEAEEEEKKKAKFFVDEDTGRIRAAREGETALTWSEAERVADRITKDIKGSGGTEEEQERKRTEEEEKKKAKFFVDEDTGRIRAAREGETALTWDEAQRVADRITRDIKGGGETEEEQERKRVEEEEKKKAKFFVDEDTGRIRAAREGETSLTWSEAERVADRITRDLKGGGNTEGEQERKRVEEEEKKKAKFFVDEDTGRIRAAREGETALTWDEAQRVADRITKDIKGGEHGEAEAPFIIDNEGNWRLNPKAKLNFTDVMVWDMYTKAQEKGESTDPLEIMKQRANDIELMRSAFGGSKSEGSLADFADAALKIKELTGGDKELKNVLAGLYNLVEKGGGRGKGDEEVTLLRQEIGLLKDEMRQRETDALREQIGTLHGEIRSLATEIGRSKRNETAKSEFDIMSQGLGIVDRRLGALENTIGGVLGKRPIPLTKKERATITEGVTAEIAAEKEVEDLGQRTFYTLS